jgi:hypothetical protein
MKEWMKTVLTLIVAAPFALALMGLFGLAIERIGETKEERDRCLKTATNGYEIRECR